jgi:hypothetical protein
MRKFVNSSIRKFNWQPAGYTGEKEKVEGRKKPRLPRRFPVTFLVSLSKPRAVVAPVGVAGAVRVGVALVAVSVVDTIGRIVPISCFAVGKPALISITIAAGKCRLLVATRHRSIEGAALPACRLSRSATRRHQRLTLPSALDAGLLITATALPVGEIAEHRRCENSTRRERDEKGFPMTHVHFGLPWQAGSTKCKR